MDTTARDRHLQMYLEMVAKQAARTLQVKIDYAHMAADYGWPETRIAEAMDVTVPEVYWLLAQRRSGHI